MHLRVRNLHFAGRKSCPKFSGGYLDNLLARRLLLLDYEEIFGDFRSMCEHPTQAVNL